MACLEFDVEVADLTRSHCVWTMWSFLIPKVEKSSARLNEPQPYHP